ncbi:MAG TPA: hypothetical protein VIK74_05650, partial [Parasegetibacter sp.]
MTFSYLLIFSAYLLVLLFVVSRKSVSKWLQLSPGQLTALFIIKIIVAALYGYIGGPLYDFRFDTWRTFYDSLIETDILRNHPPEFVTNIFHDPYQNWDMSLGAPPSTFWNDFQANAYLKIIAVFNLLSGGRYYVNILFFSCISFAGWACFYRFFLDIFPQKKNIIVLSSFFLPSFLFWGSGMYKEGLIFSGICFIIFSTLKMMQYRKVTGALVILLVAGLLILLLIRTYVFAMILPFWLIWVIFYFKGIKLSGWKLAGVVILSGITGLLLLNLILDYNILETLHLKRGQFLKEEGNSLLNPENIGSDLMSGLLWLPNALEYSLLRPFPWEGLKLLYLPSALEILIIEIMILMLFFRKKARFSLGQPVWIMILFSILMLTLIGYTVPFLGAI